MEELLNSVKTFEKMKNDIKTTKDIEHLRAFVLKLLEKEEEKFMQVFRNLEV